MLIKRISEVWGKVNETFWRGVYLLGVFSFFLPFVSVVTGCTAFGESSEVTTYTGIDLLRTASKESLGWLYLIPITVGLLLFGLSYLHRRQSPALKGSTRCWKALLAYASAWIVVILPDLTFLFESVSAEIGQIVAGASWGLVYLANVGGAIASLGPARRDPALPAGEMSGRLRVVGRVNVLLMSATLLAVVGLIVIGFLRGGFEALLAFSEVPLLIPLTMGAYLGFLGLRYGQRWAISWIFWATLALVSAAVALLIIVILFRVLQRWAEMALVAVQAAVFLAGLAGLLLGSLSESRTEDVR